MLEVNDIESEVTKVEIYNATGELVVRHNASIIGQSLDVSALSSGMYLLNIVLDDMPYTKKFFINK